MGGKGTHVNLNKGQNGSRRAAFHPTQKDHFTNDDVSDRFVLGSTRGNATVAPTARAANPAPSATPAWHRHGNFEKTKGLTVPQMRELHFRLIGCEPEAQIGKAKLREALCRRSVAVIQD